MELFLKSIHIKKYPPNKGHITAAAWGLSGNVYRTFLAKNN
jgi:hypothetical protein